MDYEKINLKVGLEIHQQLNVGRKLFCNCPTIETEEFDARILRKLRPTQSELGQVDPAALYEFRKGKFTIYLYNRKSACLVESDEEPPHPINMDAVKAAIIVALSLNSKIIQEMHVMRKIVIDGSNTTGFQRTVLVALGGSLKVGDLVIPVQTISLEEDAARLIEEKEDSRIFSLDRLGIPLVEIALAPVTDEPRIVESIALELGRLLRLTKLVARGLGTIRQDLNISVHGLSPSEVKGVQKLDLIPKIVEYETNRQNYLYQIANTLKDKGLNADSSVGNYVDVSKVFQKTSSQIVKKALIVNKGVYGLKLIGFKGLLQTEPFPNIRLGLELAEIARANGLGGVLHSDELPAYGISQEEVDQVKIVLGIKDQDGFLLLLASLSEDDAMDMVRQRALAFFEGPVPETRGPLAEGRTKYSRPRPGAARMYPETDIPLILVTSNLINECKACVPKSWSQLIKDYSTKYNLNEKLVMQLLDSNYLSFFEKVCSATKLSSSYVAVTLTESIISLNREGLGITFLEDENLFELFILVDSGAMSKESTVDVMRLMCQCEISAKAAADKLGIKAISEDELKAIIANIISSNKDLVRKQKERSFGLLMGEVMRSVRGKVDGGKVSKYLKKEIAKVSESKQ